MDNQGSMSNSIFSKDSENETHPHRTWPTTLRAIIPLPDPSAPPTDPSHLNAYRQFAAGSTVMALYPDTSCFYRAEVISSPQDSQSSGRVSRTVGSIWP